LVADLGECGRGKRAVRGLGLLDGEHIWLFFGEPASTCSNRTRMELTFQVAILNTVYGASCALEPRWEDLITGPAGKPRDGGVSPP
jgi:hypothetical protein